VHAYADLAWSEVPLGGLNQCKRLLVFRPNLPLSHPHPPSFSAVLSFVSCPACLILPGSTRSSPRSEGVGQTIAVEPGRSSKGGNAHTNITINLETTVNRPAVPVLGHAGRLGGSQPPSFQWTRRASMVVTILIACSVFCSGAHWWDYRRCRIGLPLAVGADTRATAPGPAGDEPPALASAAATPDEPMQAAAAESPAPTPAGSAATRPGKRPLTESGDDAATAAPAALKADIDWPGFRGPARDGIVRGLRIETDWSRATRRRREAAPAESAGRGPTVPQRCRTVQRYSSPQSPITLRRSRDLASTVSICA
jgi:hypothetical protein